MAETSRETIIEELTKAYCMEVETVTNYLANSIVLDGVRAEEIKKALAADVNEELLHARSLGERIKQLGGTVPGSLKLTRPRKPSSHPPTPPMSPPSSTESSRPRTRPSTSIIGLSGSVKAWTTSPRNWPSGCWPTKKCTAPSSRAS